MCSCLMEVNVGFGQHLMHNHACDICMTVNTFINELQVEGTIHSHPMCIIQVNIK